MLQASTQTKIDQFYKVVSNKNKECGIKLTNQKFGRNQNLRRQNHKIFQNSTKSINKMSKLVQSEVKIIEVKSPKKNLTPSPQKKKRSSTLEFESLQKKHKLDTTNTSNEKNISMPLKDSSPNNCNYFQKKSSFSPKKTPEKNKLSPQSNKLSPKKLFFIDRINIDNVQQSIENLNLVRKGSLGLNEFDLESIYRDKEFDIVLNDVTNTNAEKFELKDIVFPNEKHADHLLMVVMDVFSIPMNCGYFLKNELDIIFSLFTLSQESQMLFVRLLKRKLAWHRTNSIQYLEIASDLNPYFKELIRNGFCRSDFDTIDISILLNMLHVEEVRNICQNLKIDHRGNKVVLINKLLKYGNSTKSYFLGAKSPKSVLKSKTLSVLQSCICLPKNIINLFDKVLTLLHPVQDPAESIADLFLTLTNVHKGEILYPPRSKNEPFPIFSNRNHLTEFIESKNALKEIIISIEKKDWDIVKELGRLAMKHLQKKHISYEEFSLPLHIKKFVPKYVWIKVLSKSVDAFKKSQETIPEAVHILKTLIDEKDFSQSSKGRWYNELALIEMHHRKDLETSATFALNALQQDTLTEVDRSSLLDRLRKLMRRKTGISEKTKLLIEKAQENEKSKGLAPLSNSSKTIVANMANRIETGGKSKWSINIDGYDKCYGSVEMLALQHYLSEENFSWGLHCEGSLPVTFFTIFFWEELYDFFVPGTFVSNYQEAPLDLFTAEFFNNRKNSIEKKIKFIRALDLESFVDWMHNRYINYNRYKSVMSNMLFKDDLQFKDVVTCIGINGVTGICERLVSNYRLWRSGFPDLILWNVLSLKCKIVEVKGPGDFLSEKQKLWLQYLETLGIAVEVCHVEAIGRSSK